jgi:hypothetical protein
MVRLYRHRYSGIKYLNGPAIPAPLFRHKISQWSVYTGTDIQLKIAQWSGYTDTDIQAYNILMVRLYRHCYSGIKYLNGPAILALLFRHKISQWSVYPGTAIQAENISMVRLYRPAIQA